MTHLLYLRLLLCLPRDGKGLPQLFLHLPLHDGGVLLHLRRSGLVFLVKLLFFFLFLSRPLPLRRLPLLLGSGRRLATLAFKV